LIHFSYIIIIIIMVVGETKIENVIDNNLNDIFPFISKNLYLFY